MKPSLLIAGRLPPTRMVEVARVAEGSGFDQLWVADERLSRGLCIPDDDCTQDAPH